MPRGSKPTRTFPVAVGVGCRSERFGELSKRRIPPRPCRPTPRPRWHFSSHRPLHGAFHPRRVHSVFAHRRIGEPRTQTLDYQLSRSKHGGLNCQACDVHFVLGTVRIHSQPLPHCPEPSCGIVLQRLLRPVHTSTRCPSLLSVDCLRDAMPGHVDVLHSGSCFVKPAGPLKGVCRTSQNMERVRPSRKNEHQPLHSYSLIPLTSTSAEGGKMTQRLDRRFFLLKLLRQKAHIQRRACI